VTTTTIEGVGAQHPRAATGEDPRGELVFSFLPPALDDAESSTAAADFDRWRLRPRTFQRSATDCERQLLAHLGHVLPDGELTTVVTYRSRGVRHRAWPQIQEKTL
jgi:hypothetical protein